MNMKRHWFRQVTAFAVAGTLAAALAGCSLIEGPAPEVSKPRPVPEPPKEAALVPDGTAADNLPYFTKVLNDFAATEQPVLSDPLRTALVDAGFAQENMQFTQDVTPFNNEVTSMFVSVRFGERCLIGEVLSQDRSVYAEEMPALGEHRDQCLIVKGQSG